MTGYGIFLSEGFLAQTKYKGQWKNGFKHGKGELFLDTGDRVVATFSKDRINGKGVYH